MDDEAHLPNGSVQELLDEAEAAYLAGAAVRATELFRQALEIEPHSNRALHNLSVVLRSQGRQSEAIDVKRRLLALHPGDENVQFDLAALLLEDGQYAEGWRYFEARTGASRSPAKAPVLSIPRWQGEALAGKRIAVWAEQGLGDQIQFVRFVPMLQALGAKVLLVCSPGLERLFAKLDVPVRTSTSVALENVDYWTMIMSLPLWLGIDTGGIPSLPYLDARPRDLPSRIGVMTRGNPHFWNDRNRSLDRDNSSRVLELGISLHPEATGAKDMLDTAEIISGLDLVITVDTSVAHLTGAMGKPVWILLPAIGTDWRWMRDRTDSPWYPSARLYRQERPGDWTSVIDRVKADLAEFSAS